MKKALISLFACLLLCGCDAGDSGITNVSSLTSPSETLTLYAPNSALERSTHGSAKAFPLPMEDVRGLKVLEDGVLIFSGTESTTLTLLTGDGLSLQDSLELDTVLSQTDPSLQIRGDTVSFFNADTGEILVLDQTLSPRTAIPAPKGCRGAPIYDSLAQTVYYCTDTAVMAWGLEEDLHRTVKELSYPSQTLVGLHMDGSVLQCRITEGDRMETLFLSALTGKLLHSRHGDISLQDRDGWYYAQFPCGAIDALVFGASKDRPMALTPQELGGVCCFLPQSRGALTLSPPAESTVMLDYYDLESGQRTAALELREAQSPLVLEDGGDGIVYFLCQDPDYPGMTLYRWDTKSSSHSDPRVYTGVHYTRENPDLEGLAQCQALARQISEKYGLQVLVWEDAVKTEPWDYDLEPEHRVSILREALQTLDQQLSHYPEKVLEDTASHFSSLSICLVRRITGSAESGSLDTATGIQFLSGTDAHIVLTLGDHKEHTLYHELFHVMETHILGNTGVLDRWDELNPAGFRYDYSYETNRTRDAGVYLQPSTRSFIDTYSMSYPKEDRARIMEYAMLPGNRELFQSISMQRKLKTLCKGIRDAYDLPEEDAYLWEQYLE